MADRTGIEWTDASWNPTVGCSLVSPGCTNCYAMHMAGRLEAMGSAIYRGHTVKTKNGYVWNGTVDRSNWGQVIKPMYWRKPRRIFVNSMSDLFHENMPDDLIDTVFAVMALCPQHTFQVLTKRAKRMFDYMTEQWQPAPARVFNSRSMGKIVIPAESTGETRREQIESACQPLLESFKLADPDKDDLWTENGNCKAMQWQWPLPNVWLGVSVEDQVRADERIPHLLAAPASIRFLSCEPLLGPIDLGRVNLNDRLYVDALTGYHGGRSERGTVQHCLATLPQIPPQTNRISWVIAGGESGNRARPMHPYWLRGLSDHCYQTATPFFFKQWGEWRPVGPANSDLQKQRTQGLGRVKIDRCDILDYDGRICTEDAKWPKDGWVVERVGKKTAGAQIDGREHREYPL